MNILVYPEYFKGEIAKSGIEIYGKITRENHSRMYISQDGKIQSHYDKICDDGFSIPSRKNFSPVTFTYQSIALGIICCIDIDRPDIVHAMRAALEKLKRRHKIIAISAYMTHTNWFSDNRLSPNLHGVYIVLSNGCDYGVKSFIADPEGNKINGHTIVLEYTTVQNCGTT